MSVNNHTIKFGTMQFQANKGELLLFSLLKNDIYAQGKAQNRNRGGFCGMGVCQECIIELENGETVLACQTLVDKDMEIRDDD